MADLYDDVAVLQPYKTELFCDTYERAARDVHGFTYTQILRGLLHLGRRGCFFAFCRNANPEPALKGAGEHGYSRLSLTSVFNYSRLLLITAFTVQRQLSAVGPILIQVGKSEYGPFQFFSHKGSFTMSLRLLGECHAELLGSSRLFLPFSLADWPVHPGECWSAPLSPMSQYALMPIFCMWRFTCSGFLWPSCGAHAALTKGQRMTSLHRTHIANDDRFQLADLIKMSGFCLSPWHLPRHVTWQLTMPYHHTWTQAMTWESHWPCFVCSKVWFYDTNCQILTLYLR